MESYSSGTLRPAPVLLRIPLTVDSIGSLNHFFLLLSSGRDKSIGHRPLATDTQQIEWAKNNSCDGIGAAVVVLITITRKEISTRD